MWRLVCVAVAALECVVGRRAVLPAGALSSPPTSRPREQGAAKAAVFPPLLGDVIGRVLDFVPFRCRVASAHGGATVLVWGPKGDSLVLRGHAARVVGIALFPLDDRVLTWSRDGAAIVWSTSSGQVLQRLWHRGGVSSARVLRGGSRVVSRGVDGTIAVFDTATGEALHLFGRRWAAPGGSFPQFSAEVEVFPSGDRVLSWGREPRATVWDLADGVAVCRLGQGHLGVILAARVFPRGDKAITGGHDRRAIIWSVGTCSRLHVLPHLTSVTAVGVLDEGRLVVTGSLQGWLTIWCSETGLRVRTLVEQPAMPMQGIGGLEAFPGGDRLVVYNHAKAVVWGATSSAPLQLLSSAVPSTEAAALSPEGALVATCGPDWLTVWAAMGGALHSLRLPGATRRKSGWGRTPCAVAIAIGGGGGLGTTVSWRDLPQLKRS